MMPPRTPATTRAIGLAAALALALASVAAALPVQGHDASETSGRPAPPGEACYDVTYYGLALKVDPEARSIAGSLTMRARLLAASPVLILDLHQDLGVDGITLDGADVPFEHADGELRLHPAQPMASVGETFEVVVRYGGVPKVAPHPPWEGGFTWSHTASGAPWIATSCQGEGADLWWPCKDQPDDEPDTMDISVTVPDDLVDASNGRLVDVVPAKEDGWHTYHWHVSTPINAYGVALNIAPYKTIERSYTSIDGTVFPVIYWVLPEDAEANEGLVDDVLRQMRFLEETYGPYPFRIDKYGIAETPHLGMEHQSIIAYGNRYGRKGYRANPWGSDHGFDFLHLHEFAHEWWANLVTAKNWDDFWIHESFATYTEALYVEHVDGFEAYKQQMAEKRGRMLNKAAIAPREPRSTAEMYFDDVPGAPGIDIYNKGSWVLHTLRWLMGDEPFFRFLRRMAYPTPELEKVKDGGQCRFVTTDDVVATASKQAGTDLAWFFEVYVRQPALPRLEHELEDGALHLRWDVPDGLAFPLPVPVRIGDETKRIEMPDGSAVVPVPAGVEVTVDPDAWLLRARDGRSGRRGGR